MKRFAILVCLLAGLSALALAGARARAGAAAPAAHSKNIVQTAVAAGEFKTLVSLVQKTGLAHALSTAKLTVFAPTDAAFAKVPKTTLNALAADPTKLKAVLLYHVVKGRVLASQVVKLASAPTLEGQSVSIHVRNGKVYVNTAQVTKADVLASNGVIHVINKVLLPPKM